MDSAHCKAKLKSSEGMVTTEAADNHYSLNVNLTFYYLHAHSERE